MSAIKKRVLSLSLFVVAALATSSASAAYPFGGYGYGGYGFGNTGFGAYGYSNVGAYSVASPYRFGTSYVLPRAVGVGSNRFISQQATANSIRANRIYQAKIAKLNKLYRSY
ncbi:MAG: hypothetical protein AAF745_12460 [Planctomycetota bacterium]